MNERTESRVRAWESRSFSGGYDRLRDLADANFSGTVVSDGGTWLFMLNGRIVGVFHGSIEDFEDGGGTVYKSPHPSLPLLFTMLEHGGEQQAKYYTNDTPVSEADQQLKDLNFTGYIELSENVLSGDYYSVYYGGRSMSCAFVGSSERLITDDDAFQQADDEVGIYEVRAVEIDVVDIPDPEPEPEPEPAESAGAGAAAVSGAAAGQSQSADPGTTGSTDAQPERAVDTAPDQATEAEAEPAVDSAPEPADPEPASAESTEPADPEPPDLDPRTTEPDTTTAEPEPTEPAESTAAAGAAATETATDSQPAPEPADESTQEPAGTTESAQEQSTDAQTDATASTSEPGAEPTTQQPATDTPESTASGTGGSTTPAEADESDADTSPAQPQPTPSVEPTPKTAFEELRRIPSLDPDRTAVSEDDESASAGAVGATGSSTPPSTTPSTTPNSTTASADTSGSTDEPTGEAAADAALEATSTDRSTPEEKTGGAVRSAADDADPADVAVDAAVQNAAASGELHAELATREERIETLEAQLADLRVQRDGLRDERDDLRAERDQLQADIEELQGEIERLRDRLNEGTEGKRRLSPEEALSGTNLFIRYGSKGDATLEKAHGGGVEKDDVNGNLRLEHHTQFDETEVAVEGEDFQTYLDGTIQKRFVDWVVRDLLFEIQRTSSVKNLKDLYDALPEVDRAELLGDVSVEYTRDGEQYREQRQFDVVLRDRMGHPLLVADLNDSRNPATQEMMEGVIENATDVKESNDTLASAMLVTSSFFEPGALEAANEAAGGGLLGGGSKASFVKLTRKRGYHLLLVETRGGEFHVNVPEL